MPTLDLRRFLEALATSPSGLGVCIEILAMRFHSGFDDDGQNIELASLARDLLGRIDPASVECRRLDFNLSTLALACLAGPEGGAASAKLCTTIARVIVEDRVSPNVFHHLLPALFKVQPVAALHAFFGDGVAAMDRIRVSLMFNQDMDFQRHPLAEVADDKVLAWCEGDGMINYIAAASIVPMKMATGEGSVAWTSIALKILRDAPDRCAVLRQFVSRLWPHCWSGSRAVLLATNAAFLANVESFDDPEVVLLAGTESERLLEESRTTLALENDRSRLTEEQFE
jgi:hypothetical protein